MGFENILVPRGFDPLGQQREFGPEIGFNFLSMRKMHILIVSQPIGQSDLSEIDTTKMTRSQTSVDF